MTCINLKVLEPQLIESGVTGLRAETRHRCLRLEGLLTVIADAINQDIRTHVSLCFTKYTVVSVCQPLYTYVS